MKKTDRNANGEMRPEYDFATMLAELRQADRQVKSGHYIRHEDMKAWLLSWGTDDELPLPKCVCGARHDDSTPCR